MAGWLSRVPAFRFVLAASLWLLCHGAASAAIDLGFYSREMSSSSFPHAFVALRGAEEEGGATVDATYGFTARSISPALLLGSVRGHVISEPAEMFARSRLAFSLPLSDAQYRAVIGVVARWRGRNQPSYNLNRRNCVHFVREVAEAVGLEIGDAASLMKRPSAFLDHVRRANPGRVRVP